MKNFTCILSGATIALGLVLFSHSALSPQEEYVENSKPTFGDKQTGILQAKEDSEPAQPAVLPINEGRIESDPTLSLADKKVPQELYLAAEPIEYESAASVPKVLNDRFVGEVYDSAWAAQVENETWEEFYSAGLSNSDIENVQCRSTLCKIAVTHQDIEAETTFKRTLLASLNGRSGYFEDRINDSGERSTVLYRYR